MSESERAVVRCVPATCLCCMCSLRRLDEYKDLFDAAVSEAADECCRGCHEEMSAPDWPGLRCPIAAIEEGMK